MLATLPGLPIGLLLFGRRQPAGWIAGALIGYVITAFACWAVIQARIPSAAAFVVAWLACAVLTVTLTRRRAAPLVAVAGWNRHASRSLAAVLLVTLVLAVPPLARVGERDADGSRLYRAYFTADFVWHMALTAELTRFEMPPRNPYLASEQIHYYWTYFLVPAVVAETGPRPLHDVQACLKVNALLTGLLLISSVFMLAWTVTAAPIATGCAVALALLAGSFEGIYEVYRLWSARPGVRRPEGHEHRRDHGMAFRWASHRRAPPVPLVRAAALDGLLAGADRADGRGRDGERRERASHR